MPRRATKSDLVHTHRVNAPATVSRRAPARPAVGKVRCRWCGYHYTNAIDRLCPACRPQWHREQRRVSGGDYPMQEEIVIQT